MIEIIGRAYRVRFPSFTCVLITDLHFASVTVFNKLLSYSISV